MDRGEGYGEVCRNDRAFMYDLGGEELMGGCADVQITFCHFEQSEESNLRFG